MDFSPIGFCCNFCWKVFQGQVQLTQHKETEHCGKVKDNFGQSKRKVTAAAAGQNLQTNGDDSSKTSEEDKKLQIRSSQVSETASVPLSTAVEPADKSIVPSNNNSQDPNNWTDIINQALIESSIKYSPSLVKNFFLDPTASNCEKIEVECAPVAYYDDLIDVESCVDEVEDHQLVHGLNINILGQPLFCENCFKHFPTFDKLTSHLKQCKNSNNNSVKKNESGCDQEFPLLSSIKEEESSLDSNQQQQDDWNSLTMKSSGRNSIGGFNGAASSSCSSFSSVSSSSKGKAGGSPSPTNGGFFCTHCGKAFRTKDLLGKHTNTHEKTHTCSICFHSFSQKYHLVKHHEMLHRRPIPPDRPYHCVECDKWFTRSRGLTKHSRIHTGEKLNCCPFPYCEKKFPVKSELTSHIRTHTGEKPFRCPICLRSFAEKSTLKTHLYTHTQAKPYKCDYCEKRFNQHSTLKGHMFTHTR